MPTNNQTRRATARDLIDPADAVDPIGVLRAASTRPVPIGITEGFAKRGCLAIGGFFLFGFGFVKIFSSGPAHVALAVSVGFCGLYYASWRAGTARPLRAIKRHAPHIAAVATEEPAERAGIHSFVGVALPLEPGSASPKRAFDPMAPADRAMAHRLYTCRVTDGVAFVDGLRVDLAHLDRHPAPVQTRVAEWAELWGWLNGLSDPRAAWLGAMALAEESLTARAEAALASLGDPPWADDLRRAMLTDGRYAARLAAALHWADVEALDALRAAVDAPLAQRIESVRARLRLPDPPFERWLSEPGWGPALVTLDAVQLEPAHWQRLVAEHPQPWVAAQAATRTLYQETPHALRAARALLDREDVWDAAHAWPDRELLGWVELMLIRLGTDGAAEDLPRIGRWAEVEGLRRAVRRELKAARGRTGLPDGGGLALAPAAGGELCMAEPTGELCMAEPTGSAGRAPGRSPRGS